MTTPDAPGDLTESDMKEIRARSRQRILQKREEALTYRREYDAQLAAGEIGRDLHRDLVAAAMNYHRALWKYRDEYPGEFPEIDGLKQEVVEYDGHVADNPETPPEPFAATIDALEDVALRLGFAEVEGR